jgi:hypothetical protein
MPSEYTYGIHHDLSREALFFLIVVEETRKETGIDDIVGIGAVLLGQRFIPTRGKFAGAVKGTSYASVMSRRLLPFDFKHKFLPTVTSFKSLVLLQIKFTRNLGTFVSRAIPGVGWAILASDVAAIIYRSVNAYNQLVTLEDRL